MRIYVPATVAMVETLRDEQTLHAPRGWAFAVTQALRDFYTSGDEEESADVAFDEAARTSLRLLTAYDGSQPLRRVVLTFDVPDAAVVEASDMGEATVRVESALAVADLAALHIDVRDAEDAVAAGKEAIDAAELGDEDAELTVGDCLDIPLAWYDPSELGVVVELL